MLINSETLSPQADIINSKGQKGRWMISSLFDKSFEPKLRKLPITIFTALFSPFWAHFNFKSRKPNDGKYDVIVKVI